MIAHSKMQGDEIQGVPKWVCQNQGGDDLFFCLLFGFLSHLLVQCGGKGGGGKCMSAREREGKKKPPRNPHTPKKKKKSTPPNKKDTATNDMCGVQGAIQSGSGLLARRDRKTRRNSIASWSDSQRTEYSYTTPHFHAITSAYFGSEARMTTLS